MRNKRGVWLIYIHYLYASNEYYICIDKGNKQRKNINYYNLSCKYFFEGIN
jgi:hypothetical protein